MKTIKCFFYLSPYVPTTKEAKREKLVERSSLAARTHLSWSRDGSVVGSLPDSYFDVHPKQDDKSASKLDGHALESGNVTAATLQSNFKALH